MDIYISLLIFARVNVDDRHCFVNEYKHNWFLHQITVRSLIRTVFKYTFWQLSFNTVKQISLAISSLYRCTIYASIVGSYNFMCIILYRICALWGPKNNFAWVRYTVYISARVRPNTFIGSHNCVQDVYPSLHYCLFNPMNINIAILILFI